MNLKFLFFELPIYFSEIRLMDYYKDLYILYKMQIYEIILTFFLHTNINEILNNSSVMVRPVNVTFYTTPAFLPSVEI